jgi:hypothetical protein
MPLESVAPRKIVTTGILLMAAREVDDNENESIRDGGPSSLRS